MQRVKIVCTLGPATATTDVMVSLIEAGMDAARLNFSHGNHREHRQLFQNLREAARRTGRPIAVIGDLSGPKIRVGRFAEGQILLRPGAEVTLTPDAVEGNQALIPHSYPPLARDVHPGEAILLDDGLLELQVLAIDGEQVRCRVTVGGPLKDRKGVNLPGTRLSTPGLTDKDREDLLLAKELGVDYLALSFVRSAADIRQAQALAQGIPVIAKIEKPEAVAQLEEILEAADGVMVARGDLGVEIGHEKVPLIQKRILSHLKVRDKPTITATQMLDSMIQTPHPTRAEVSDVANAVLDGTDAVMLSGETSIGRYPVQTVRTMNAIIQDVEKSALFSSSLKGGPKVTEQSYSNAIATAAARVADGLGLAALAVYSESGRSARLVSAHRPAANIICFSRHERVLNQLALLWGVRPLLGEWVHGVEGVVGQAERELILHGLAQPGDNIAVTFAKQQPDEPFQTNAMLLWKIRAPSQSGDQ